MSRLFVVGDIHGHIDISTLNTKNFPEQNELTKEDIVFQLGDFGLLWKERQTDTEKHWLSWLENKNFTILIIPGNHENWNLIEELHIVEKYGSNIWKYSDSIYFVPRGSVLTIDNKTFFCFGGATSTDKLYRQEGISWWKKETHSIEDENRTFDVLDEVRWEVDYILTHTAPKRVMDFHFRMFEKINCVTSNFLEYILTNISFKEWHHGHIHLDGSYAEHNSNDEYASRIHSHYQIIKELY